MNIGLIREAEVYTTGAEIHKTRELVAWYKGAMKSTGPKVHEWQRQAEEALEAHVGKLRTKRFKL